jgi:hypothetical protein
MTNHLTPSELANESGLDRTDVIAKCVELGVPIYEGKIDKTLFRASMQDSGLEPGSAGSLAGHSPG